MSLLKQNSVTAWVRQYWRDGVIARLHQPIPLNILSLLSNNIDPLSRLPHKSHTATLF
jgi:hypothetical protein